MSRHVRASRPCYLQTMRRVCMILRCQVSIGILLMVFYGYIKDKKRNAVINLIKLLANNKQISHRN